jgi:hypothetical protein
MMRMFLACDMIDPQRPRAFRDLELEMGEFAWQMYERRLLARNVKALWPDDPGKAREFLVGLVEEAIGRLKKLLRKHQEHDEMVKTLDAELMTLDVSPEAVRIRSYKDASDRAYHRSMAAILKLRKNGVFPICHAGAKSSAKLSIVSDQDVERRAEPADVGEQGSEDIGQLAEIMADPDSDRDGFEPLREGSHQTTVHCGPAGGSPHRTVPGPCEIPDSVLAARTEPRLREITNTDFARNVASDQSAGISDRSETDGVSGSEPTVDSTRNPESEPTAADREGHVETLEAIELQQVADSQPPGDRATGAGGEPTADQTHKSVDEPIAVVCELIEDPIVQELEILARYDEHRRELRKQARAAQSERNGEAKRADGPLAAAGRAALSSTRPMNRKERRRLRAEGTRPSGKLPIPFGPMREPNCETVLADIPCGAALEKLATQAT